MSFEPRDFLVVVDVQLDFCAGGALAVPGGEEVVGVVNRVAAAAPGVVLTQDWHPPGHRSFASSWPDRRPFDVVEMPYGDQVLWPDHCVQGSPGAAFHPALDVDRASVVVRKGTDPELDSYSAFFENDRTTPTGLGGLLAERNVGRVVLVGLATDFCVLYTGLDAARLGFDVVRIEDACRALDVDGSLAAARTKMADAGVTTVTADRWLAGEA